MDLYLTSVSVDGDKRNGPMPHNASMLVLNKVHMATLTIDDSSDDVNMLVT